MGGGGVEEKVEKAFPPSWNRLGSENVCVWGGNGNERRKGRPSAVSHTLSHLLLFVIVHAAAAKPDGDGVHN